MVPIISSTACSRYTEVGTMLGLAQQSDITQTMCHSLSSEM
jgi:hypothetical protein